MRQAIELSESTLYPVLRRLQKDGCLEVYDMECGGRNRRYYQITERGSAQLGLYREEWKKYSEKITALFDGCLEVYDMECGGRNRRYYQITERGSAQLGLYREEWKKYSEKITALFDGGIY